MENEMKKRSVKKLKLKKEDNVWVRLPMLATIINVNNKYGYTLRTEDGNVWQYFDDTEVDGSWPHKRRKG